MEPALAPRGRDAPRRVACCASWRGASGSPISSRGRTTTGPIDAILDHPATGHATVAALRAEGGIRALASLARGPSGPRRSHPVRQGRVLLGARPRPRAAAAAGPRAAARVAYPLVLRQGRTLTHFHGFYDHGRALPSLAAPSPSRCSGSRPPTRPPAGWGRARDPRVQPARGDGGAGARHRPRARAGTVWMRDGWDGLNRLTSGEAVPARRRGGRLRVLRRPGRVRRGGGGGACLIGRARCCSTSAAPSTPTGSPGRSASSASGTRRARPARRETFDPVFYAADDALVGAIPRHAVVRGHGAPPRPPAWPTRSRCGRRR